MEYLGLRRRRQDNNATNNATNNSRASNYATQHDLFGPISGALLVDPVRIQSEITPGAFERVQITRWLNDRGTSPTTRNRATVADLVPAHDIQQEIRELVRRYPNAQIVRDWLQEQPAWYSLAIQRIRNTGAPVVQAMSRAIEPVRQVMPSADTCLRCCAKTAETGTGAVVGAGVGACAGCMCALGLSGEAEEVGNPMTEEQKAAMAAFLTPTGAAVGAFVGAILGPEECLRCAGGACKAACEAQGNYGGSRRKTRKGKRKKRRKTHKRRRKRTIKKKRRGRKSMKRTKRRKKH